MREATLSHGPAGPLFRRSAADCRALNQVGTQHFFSSFIILAALGLDNAWLLLRFAKTQRSVRPRAALIYFTLACAGEGSAALGSHVYSNIANTWQL